MKVSPSSSQQVQRSQEQPAQVNRQARDYARLSPDQKRDSAVTRQPVQRVQHLGGRIDVQA